MNQINFSEEYPFTGKSWDRGKGIRINYVDEGEGPTIVCVHGNPTWSFHFRHMIRGLSTMNRVIAIDHVGCGLSDRPSPDQYGYRLADRIDDLEGLLDHLGIEENATLLAHDWGGAIGFGAAGRNPDRFSHLVAVNTAAFPLQPGMSFPPILGPARGPLGKWLICQLNTFLLGTLFIGVKSRKLSRAEKAGYKSPYKTSQDRLAIHRFVEDIPVSPADPSWETLLKVENDLTNLKHLPLLLLWGEKDPVFNTDFRDHWQKLWPEAQVHSWPDAGHLLLDEFPEKILPIIRQFRNRNRVRGRLV